MKHPRDTRGKQDKVSGQQRKKVVVRDEKNEAVPRTKQHDIYVRVDQVKDTIYTYQTGKFPITSYRGHKYIMIMCVLVSPG